MGTRSRKPGKVRLVVDLAGAGMGPGCEKTKGPCLQETGTFQNSNCGKPEIATQTVRARQPERTYFFAAFFLRAAMVASYITGVPIMMDA